MDDRQLLFDKLRVGLPDLGMITLSELAERTREIIRASLLAWGWIERLEG